MRLKLVISLILSVLCVGIACGDDDPVSKLVVAGKAVLQKPADLFSLDVGVVTQDEDAQKALRHNADKMQKVIQSLQRAGLTRSDYQTGRFSIRPVYTRPPRNPPADWIATIQGYEVNNSINVRTDKLKLAGELIDAVNQAGANSVNNIRFELKDPRQYRAESIHAAVAHAEKDAKVLAEASGVKLSRILRISLDQAQVSPLRTERAPMAFMSKATTPIEAGDVDVHSEVLVVYEIEQ